MLQRYFTDDCPKKKEVLISHALEFGSIAMLDWLYSRLGRAVKKIDPEFTYLVASRCGNVLKLEWLYRNGFRGAQYRRNLRFAGTVDAIRWFREDRGCQWSGAEIFHFAEVGKVDMMEYAIANGCPWYRGIYHTFIQKDLLEVLQWAITKKLPYSHPNNIPALTAWAVESGYVNTRSYEWLKSQSEAATATLTATAMATLTATAALTATATLTATAASNS